MSQLVAPAGNSEKLKIAFAYGADAVYLAGRRFGLRSGADNFSKSQLREAFSYARQLGKKTYLALNAVLPDLELAELPGFLSELSERPDGVICSDLAVVETVRDWSPQLPIHLSTQASVLNSATAAFYRDMGVSRVVLGRETSLEQAAQIKEKTGLEVEVFIQGAMCMSFSGHCTISNYMAGRDSNQGGCVHSCRFNYQLEQGETLRSSHFMSAKDLRGIELVGRAQALGIDALKIEGRMKSGLYLATTVRAYRSVLDQPQTWPFWAEELEKIPHRDYGTGSLDRPADIEQTWDADDHLASPWQMAGQVLEQVDGRLVFLAKNRLKLGEELELLGFDGRTWKVALEKMVGLGGEPQLVAQPGQVVWLDAPTNLGPWVVARMLGA
ncbi:MAG: hypothetical protein A2527_10645 [Candidatus Lambdaproteobacteria bacterium RIFOXYD2_FULL_50_16]|uniref:Peptidase family U32 C-terminal domain-containing protein n=1 Tax=Candidatus Lambdaproteobacteria bacterium RIFOXYD2_FULL_50_16 TaxID=1817772 RepID=A0A1F6GGP9_9PROT|nr:MAG: hypothetical protein A2527_10645 [Candidatus Lambdaproteobacteria bacterium RIFOXYD2_FULL_50_16]